MADDERIEIIEAIRARHESVMKRGDIELPLVAGWLIAKDIPYLLSEVERQSGAADGRDVLSAAVKFRQVMRSGRDAGAGADAYFTYAEALREFSEAVDQFLAAPGEAGEGEG